MFFSASFHCHCIHLPLFWLLPRFQPFQARPKEKNELVYGCSNSGQSYFLTSKLLSGTATIIGDPWLGSALANFVLSILARSIAPVGHTVTHLQDTNVLQPRSIVISIICSKLPREPLYLDRTLMTFQLA